MGSSPQAALKCEPLAVFSRCGRAAGQEPCLSLPSCLSFLFVYLFLSRARGQDALVLIQCLRSENRESDADRSDAESDHLSQRKLLFVF